MRVLAIVPAFNESRNLADVISAIRSASPTADVCVVDDGSTDDTAIVARRAGATTVLRCAVNLGIGGAVQVGYLWARDHGYDIAVQVDGDGQHDATCIETLVAPLERNDADVVIGTRFHPTGGFQSTPARRLGIRYLTWFLRLRCEAEISDPTSGFRAAGRRAIALFSRVYPSDYPEPEAIALARRSGLRVTEVPVRMAERAHGRSSITSLRAVYYFVKVSLALVMLPSRRLDRSDEISGG